MDCERVLLGTRCTLLALFPLLSLFTCFTLASGASEGVSPGSSPTLIANPTAGGPSINPTIIDLTRDDLTNDCDSLTMVNTAIMLFWGQRYWMSFAKEDAATKRGEYALQYYVSALEEVVKERLKPGSRSGALSNAKGKELARDCSEDEFDTVAGRAHESSVDGEPFDNMDGRIGSDI